ncbi:hypothetical protein HWV62_8889 [Athelia sp. TMB]|nr:hypothetical protein HWV62_36352 [Athelia sp. TMB]KAF7985048.1 hypothetical protein HWV62_8889 [Athelia sp. TMB]
MDNEAAPAGNHATEQPTNDASVNKGKGKVVDNDTSMEVEEEEDDEDEDDSDEEEEEEEEEEDDYQEIDPSVILAPGARRTRGKKVDYTSAEALAKAGLAAEPAHGEDETDEDVSMREE